MTPAPLRLAPAAAALLAAVSLAACGGGSGTPTALDRDETIAQELSGPAASWSKLTPKDQRDTLGACRLEVAIGLARDSGATSAPYFNSRFAAVMKIKGDVLHRELTRRLADAAHRGETIAQGCRAVVESHVDPAAMRRAPHADFATPVTVRRGVLTLAVDGDRTVLRARISPVGARLQIGNAPGRARTTARWTMRRENGVTVVDLRDIPRGTSYLELRVGSWHRVLIVHGARASRFPPPRTFVPIMLHGQGQVGLPVLYVPQPAVVTPRVAGAPLALTSGTTLLVAIGAGDGNEPVALRPGRYRDVRVRAPGAWFIRIAPQR